jgi:cobalt-zinc-cadmium efflux system outer membrane protein
MLTCLRLFRFAALLLVFLPACGTQSYQPGSLDVDAAAKSFASRRMDAPGLRDYLVAHGYDPSDWPVKHWGLRELTLTAFYYHPDLAAARAQAQAARAEARLERQASSFKITPLLQHHSRQSGGNESPWSLGFDVEIPLASSARRAAVAERAGYLAESAELNLGSVAWEVRSRVRARLLDLYAARAVAQTLSVEVQTRLELVALLGRRLESGLVSATDLGTARVKLAETQGQSAVAATLEQQASGKLAAAIAVSPAEFRSHALSFSEYDSLPEVPQSNETLREALLNRLDMRRKLLDYAASDALVKLEVARQYPGVTLRPGYLWDQGDHVWSLATDLLLPTLLGNTPGVQVAQARREVAAQQATGYQMSIINEVHTALAGYAQVAAGAKAAAQANQLLRFRNTQLQKQFDAGYIDRLELAQARLETLSVERNAQAAHLETQRVLGQLEDALQRPLSGEPLPLFAGTSEPTKQSLQRAAAR